MYKPSALKAYLVFYQKLKMQSVLIKYSYFSLLLYLLLLNIISKISILYSNSILTSKV
jgi:hypothetical protein